MNYLIFVIAAISILIGTFVGALIVWFIYFWRRRQIVNSLIEPENAIGLYGTVEIPFDANSKGKIRINMKGSMVDVMAITEEAKEFVPGDRVFVIQMRENKALVVAAESIM